MWTRLLVVAITPFPDFRLPQRRAEGRNSPRHNDGLILRYWKETEIPRISKG